MREIIARSICCTTYIPYLCTVFFMVLDLRLAMKIGCRETTFSFFIQIYTESTIFFSFLIERLKDIAK